MSTEDRQPLLPQRAEGETPESVSRKERVAQALESNKFHKLVLTLITIDAICVLADLSYTFLLDDCSPLEEEPRWLTVLAYISLVITSIFLIEIPLAIYAFGSKFYNPFAKGEERTVHSGLHLLDAVVILVTFIIEVFLKGRERELASLLILFRLWRLIKLISGVAVGVGETSEEDARRVYELQATLREKEAQLEELKNENKSLKEQLSR